MGSFFLKEEEQRRETEKEIGKENALQSKSIYMQLHNCCHKKSQKKHTFMIITVLVYDGGI